MCKHVLTKQKNTTKITGREKRENKITEYYMSNSENQRMTLADIKRIGLKVGRGLKVLTKVYKGM